MAIPAVPLNGAGAPDVTEWASLAVNGPGGWVEPTAGEKHAGWAPAQIPPAEYFNWFNRAVYLWLLRVQLAAGFYDQAAGAVVADPRDVAGADTYPTASYVWGSPTLDDAGNADHDARAYFRKAKGAWRSGVATGTLWDDANVGLRSFGHGLNAKAAGQDAVALGRETVAESVDALAVGAAAKVDAGAGGTALGRGSWCEAGTDAFAAQGGHVSANYATAIGGGTLASFAEAVALGRLSQATAAKAFAFGRLATASAGSAVAIGDTPTAAGVDSIAIGSQAQTTHAGAIAVGPSAQTAASGGVAIGSGALATGVDSLAIGPEALTGVELRSIAIGKQAMASGEDAVALGGGDAGATMAPQALGEKSVALGAGSRTTLNGAQGLAAAGGQADGANAVALGYRVNSTGYGALSHGYSGNTPGLILASGDGSRAGGYCPGGFGRAITASGDGSEASGYSGNDGMSANAVTASGLAARAHGTGLTASADYSEAVGFGALARLRGSRMRSGAPFGGAFALFAGQSAPGEGQAGDFECKQQTRDAGSGVLDPAGVAAAVDTFSLQDESAMSVEGRVLAISSGVLVEAFALDLVVKRTAGVTTIVFGAAGVAITANALGWTVNASVAGSGRVVITVAASAGVGEVRWDANLRLSEIVKPA
jgi:hypothetical protein